MNLQWRRPHHIDQTIDNVLYTFCADNVLRIWTGSDTHGQQHPQLWGQVDLAVSIQDRNAAGAIGASNLRWGFIMHGRDFSAATEQAVQEGGSKAADDAAALEHLITVANRSPEICLVFDGEGSNVCVGIRERRGRNRRRPTYSTWLMLGRATSTS